MYFRGYVNRLLIFIISLLFFNIAMAKSFVVDTDLYTDDVIALIYLLKNKEVNLAAITVKTSTMSCESAFSKINELLAMTHHTPVPVGCENAVDLLKKTLAEVKTPIDILLLGPQTNVGQLLQKNPALRNKIYRIYVMGGAIHVPGNVQAIETKSKNKVAEWNIYADPQAALDVLHAGIPVFMIPLDMTQRVPYTRAFLLKLKNIKTPAAQRVYTLMNRHPQGGYFWDPLAAVVAVHPSLGIFKTEKLTVLQSPEKVAGATKVDVEQGVEVQVGIDVRKKLFEAELLRVLST